jgi:hypothetical protein
MPKGPQGQKRPADVIGAAIHIAKIATGEIEDSKPLLGKEYAQKGGLKGGVMRAKMLTANQRRLIATKAAKARWKKDKKV